MTCSEVVGLVTVGGLGCVTDDLPELLALLAVTKGLYPCWLGFTATNTGFDPILGTFIWEKRGLITV